MSDRSPSRRFYGEARAGAEAGGFAVLLDTRPVRTPGKALLRVPTMALAEALAAEWGAQGETILPQTMPLTRLANVVLDHTPKAREALIAHVVKFAETDLLSHRAESPQTLVRRQAALWDPLLDWAGQALAVKLMAAAGVVALNQPQAALDAVRALLSGLDDFALTGAAHAAGLSGSAVIALALQCGRLTGQDAFEAACLDELFQLETWGEDREARARLDRACEEYKALAAWFGALEPIPI